ncbi:MAG: hypothetical protein HY328_09680 [Chloroflexi bacterium]|nr:hypothetical protein [Chloroflexota bacterium]
MNKFQNFLNDIRSGENIELYIIMLAAFVLLILDRFGYVDPEWMYSINIAILALIAISLLGNRRQIESLREMSYDVNKTFMNEFPDDFENKLLSSNEIWILGLTLGKTSIRYQHDLRRALRSGRHVKVMLLNPHGLAIQIAAKRGYDRQDME